MGALDMMLSEAEVQCGITEREASSVLSGLVSLINEQPEGVTGFLDRFNRAELSSWLSSCFQGSTKPLDEATVTKTLGKDAIDRIASKSGLSFTSAAAALGLMLPEVFRRLVPRGTALSQLPTELVSYLPSFAGRVTSEIREPMQGPEQIVVKQEESKRRFLLPALALLGVLLLGWLWMSRHLVSNVAFDAAEQARLAQTKASAALASLTPGFTAQNLAAVLNMNVINFASGSAQIPTESIDFLNKASAAFKMAPSGTVFEVAGHTDNTGDEESNFDLSRQRANAVRDYLIAQGVDPSELQANGYGPSNPVATNDTEEGRFRNRRIEFTVLP